MTPDPPAPTPDYLVLGHLSLDHTTHGKDDPLRTSPHLGGTAAYAALTARALGRHPALVTSASDALDFAPLGDIPVARVRADHSTTFRNDHAGSHRTQMLLARAADLGASSVPREWRSAGIVHLAPIAAEFPAELVESFRGGPFLGVTPQGWMRRWDADGIVRHTSWEAARSALEAADAVVVSLQDLDGDEGEVDGLASVCGLLVLTEGAAGARVYWNGDVRRIPAPTVEQIDPTGAGDVFAASFFVRLHQTRDPWEAARFANILAATSVTRVALDGVPTPDEARRASMVWVR